MKKQPLEHVLDQAGLALFAAAFHNNTQAAAVNRLADGLFVDVNNAWLSLSGYTRAEIEGKTTLELGIWQNQDARDKALALLKENAGGTGDIEADMVTRQGVLRSVQMRSTSFLLRGVPHVLSFFTDVTRQALAAQTVREELDFIRRITARVPVLLFQYRRRADGSGHFPFVSQANEQIFGVSPESVMVDDAVVWNRVHREDRDDLMKSVSESAGTMKPWTREFRMVLAKGRTLWILGDAAPQKQDDGAIIWTGSLTDITRRRAEYNELLRTRAQMQEKSRDLNIALDHMSQGILVMEGDGRITQYNRRLLELIDVDQQQMDQFSDAGSLLEFQRSRGDFGPNFEWVETSARPQLEGQPVLAVPGQYLRRSRQGRMLEIKTHGLPDGGVVRTFSDVTHFVDAQTALFNSESRFRSLTALSSDWFWEQDAQFRFVSQPGETQEGRPFPSETDVGKRRWEISAIQLTASQWAEHRRTVEAHRVFRDFEFQRKGPDGKMSWLSISGMPVFDGDGVFCGYRGVGRDISEQKRREDESQRLAFYDTLTGLPNRRLLLDRLAQALVTSGRSQTRGALLFIDLDNFKDLNDTLGHDVGDLLLEKVANRLVTCVRQGDTVGRFGGDEFVVMLEDLSARSHDAMVQVRTVGEKILSTLNLPYDLQGKAHYSTPSIGVTLFSGQKEGVDELLKRADLAMYQAKSAGRNTLRFFDPEMQSAVARRATMEADLRRGLEQGELILHFQTVVNEVNVVTGVEALVRWQHPVRGLVPPNEFIPVAEQTGLILQLGQWVLMTACRQLVSWQGDPVAGKLSIAINISAREFHQADFVRRILDAVDETGCDPNLLKLELTETLLLDDIQDAIRKMSELRKIGVRFSLDDFGTGYSSLSYLKQLPLDELKIDQSFVRDVLVDASDAAIARTIVALAHSLGLSVVAEGVENAGQRRFLLDSGCKLFQGFSFGRPAAVSEIHLGRLPDGFDSTMVDLLR